MLQEQTLEIGNYRWDMPSVRSREIERGEWPALLKKYAELPGFPGVYILGCFNRRVTLYSQQVRALNLAYGLDLCGFLQAGTKVAVIGGGAAGLTAAAALATRKCEVELFEKLPHILRLQANCNIRRLHPHIYDWPNSESDGDEAQLPLLNWSAGLAADVAKQLLDSWNLVRAQSAIEMHEKSMPNKLIRRKGGTRYRLRWTNSDGKQIDTDVDIVVIAIGFGLESTEEPYKSYWSGDDLDDSFVNRNGQRWLVSGFGDGALTDLIRSCTDGFDFASFAHQFDATNGSGGLRDDINEIHSHVRSSDEDISKAFGKLSIPPDLFQKLQPYIRTLGPQVFLTGRSSPYGRGSSILNRLIVLMLERSRAFRMLQGPCENVEKIAEHYEVTTGKPPTSDEFDRVILRHGTRPLVKNFCDQVIGEGLCDDLEAIWSAIPPELDRSRFPLWAPNFFGPENSPRALLSLKSSEVARAFVEVVDIQPTPPVLARAQAFQASVDKFGLFISHLAFYKELRGDGSSTVTYSVEKLTATRGAITGVHFTFGSIVGKIGDPALDSLGERLGMRWIPDVEHPVDKTMEDIQARVRSIAGTVVFRSPLTPGDEPLSFSLQAIVLNGDALSSWEFNQFYDWPDRVSFDKKQLGFPLEYVARVVWCPVETLTIQITLPHEDVEPLSVRTYALPPKLEVNPRDVLRKSILHVVPPSDAKSSPSKIAWEKQVDRGSYVETTKFTNPSPLTWKLVVNQPAVGSAFSVEWKLPDWMTDSETESMVRDAESIRKKILEYAVLYRAGSHDLRAKQVRSRFLALHRGVKKFLAENNFRQPFDLSLMVCDDAERRLKFVGGTCNEGKPRVEQYDFWLPFGLGLSGACLKQGNAIFVFSRKLADERTGPEYYIDIPGSKLHQSMIAVPMIHPQYDSFSNDTVEPGRMCVGVLDISFEDEPTWLIDLLAGKKTVRNFVKLREICDDFGDEICRIFGD